VLAATTSRRKQPRPGKRPGHRRRARRPGDLDPAIVDLRLRGAELIRRIDDLESAVRLRQAAVEA
jgi:hypothetical protein